LLKIGQSDAIIWMGDMPMTALASWPDESVLIPDLLRAAPQVRPVLDRYGLRGCGGPLGPHESLGFFARAHDVPLDRLLKEVRDRLGRPTPGPGPAPAEAGGRLGDAIYRPFFKAGIVVVLTLGAGWGAYLLLRIALSGSFTAAGLHEVNAHGHAQIFGWVGLFVMGFAYQAFPRFKHANLAHPRLAYASLALMAAGLVGRSVLEPLAGSYPGLAAFAVGASVLEVLAIGLFVGVVAATWRASGKPLAFYDYYILSALAWFVVQAVYETVYLAATLAAAGPEELVPLVATWQTALRDIQIHGFALLMILGVSQRLFPNMYGFAEPNRRKSMVALLCLNGAVLGEAAGLVLMRLAGHAWAALWYASVWLLAGAVVVLLADWRIFAAPKERDRSLKFLRAAYVWLLASLAMLVLMPVYQYVLLPAVAPDSVSARIGFSHAYYGAVRHAVTVGFISLMIVGVAAKVVPTLNGVDVRSLSRLWLPFALLNAGCTVRVVAQTLTDVAPLSFPVAGVSGLLEVLGLALWGAHLWSVMSGRHAGLPGEERAPAPGHPPLGPGVPICPAHRIGAVLDRYPGLLETFLSFGFRPLANPLLRRAIAPHVTIERACGLLGVDMPQLLAALDAVRERQAPRTYTLPVLSGEAGAPEKTGAPSCAGS
jgi:hypothetical protein